MACRFKRPGRVRVGARVRPERVRIVAETVDIGPRIDDGRLEAPSGTGR